MLRFALAVQALSLVCTTLAQTNSWSIAKNHMSITWNPLSAQSNSHVSWSSAIKDNTDPGTTFAAGYMEMDVYTNAYQGQFSDSYSASALPQWFWDARFVMSDNSHPTPFKMMTTYWQESYYVVADAEWDAKNPTAGRLATCTASIAGKNTISYSATASHSNPTDIEPPNAVWKNGTRYFVNTKLKWYPGTLSYNGQIKIVGVQHSGSGSSATPNNPYTLPSCDTASITKYKINCDTVSVTY